MKNLLRGMALVLLFSLPQAKAEDIVYTYGSTRELKDIKTYYAYTGPDIDAHTLFTATVWRLAPRLTQVEKIEDAEVVVVYSLDYLGRVSAGSRTTHQVYSYGVESKTTEHTKPVYDFSCIVAMPEADAVRILGNGPRCRTIFCSWPIRCGKYFAREWLEANKEIPVERPMAYGDVATLGELRRNAKLLNAAADGDTYKVYRLLARGADANAKTEDGITALMVATLSAWNGHTKIVKALIDAGADVNAETEKGTTALMWAELESHSEIVDLLKQAGAKK